MSLRSALYSSPAMNAAKRALNGAALDYFPDHCTNQAREVAEQPATF